MRFFSSPKGEQFQTLSKNFIEFEEFSWFKLYITDRNWVGDTYCSKAECMYFVNELKQLDELLHSLFGFDESKVYKIPFYIDASVFSKKTKSNEKLHDFLEELDRFYQCANGQNNSQEIKKIQKKLRGHLNKYSSYPFLYRWLQLNSNHPFAQEIENGLHFSLIEYNNRFKNSMRKDIMNTREKKKNQLKEGFVGINGRESFKKENSFIKQLFEYAFSDSSVFYFAVMLLLKQIEELNDPESLDLKIGSTVLSFVPSRHLFAFHRPRNKVEFTRVLIGENDELGEMTDENKEHFHFSFSSTFNGESKSFDEIFDAGLVLDSEKMDEIKTIALWAESKNELELIKRLPVKPVLHKIQERYFKQLEINKIAVSTNLEIIGGSEGKEIFVDVLMFIGKNPYAFPIVSPKNWDTLNHKQQLVMAYAICFFHDFYILSKLTDEKIPAVEVLTRMLSDEVVLLDYNDERRSSYKNPL